MEPEAVQFPPLRRTEASRKLLHIIIIRGVDVCVRTRYLNMEIILMLMELKCLMNLAPNACIVVRTKRNSIWLCFVFAASRSLSHLKGICENNREC